MFVKMINIGIIHQFPLYRVLLRDYLREQRNFNILFDDCCLERLVHSPYTYNMDVLLLDVHTLEGEGSNALQRFRSEHPCLKVILLSADQVTLPASDDFCGYVTRSQEPEELFELIRNAASDMTYATTSLSVSEQKSILLTERELKVLQLLWEEKSNKEIADLLFLSIKSIEKIRQDMKVKLSARSLTGMLKYGVKKNFIKVTQ